MSRSSPESATPHRLRGSRPLRRLIAALGLAVAVSLLPSIALATTQLTYRVSGIQIGLSSDGTNFTSSFAGAAASTTTAGEYGLWHAAVVRTQFNANGDAAIVGGTFALQSTRRLATGTFTGGTVDRTFAAPGCGNEAFAVSGLMTATIGSTVGTGTFNATLTHFRRWIFGQCRTLGATVAGAVSLTLGP